MIKRKRLINEYWRRPQVSKSDKQQLRAKYAAAAALKGKLDRL